jgi:hypothetical protein
MPVSGSGHFEAAYTVEYFCPCFALEVFPKAVRAHHKRNVVRAFRIGVTKDPCLSRVRSSIVYQPELFQDETPPASVGQFPGAGETHGAAAEDNDIVLGHVELQNVENLFRRPAIPAFALLTTIGRSIRIECSFFSAVEEKMLRSGMLAQDSL